MKMTTMKRALVTVLVILYSLENGNECTPGPKDIKRMKSDVKSKNESVSMFKISKIQHLYRSKKELNKTMHILRGNKKNERLRCGWWNNKSSQCHSAKNTKNQVAEVLKVHKLDVLSISEANVYKEDDSSDLKIKGYELICDNLLEKGRTRSAMYINEKFQYKLRKDLMEQNTPEVWLEIDMKKTKRTGN